MTGLSAIGCQLSARRYEANCCRKTTDSWIRIGGRMQDFRNRDVWKKAHELTLATYRLTATFPDEERFGLTSQLRRGSASIGANLAEECGRGSDADFGRFVQNAMGSSSEVEYHFLLTKD